MIFLDNILIYTNKNIAHKCKAVISTAAASQVGRMIIRHF